MSKLTRGEARRALRAERHRAKHPNPPPTNREPAERDAALAAQRQADTLQADLGREPTEEELAHYRRQMARSGAVALLALAACPPSR